MGDKLWTHYDNLQVTRQAAPEVIAGAYGMLCAKYGADTLRGDARCQRILRLINEGYAVLSDPVARQAHDDWIARQERADDDSAVSVSPSATASFRASSAAARRTQAISSSSAGAHLRRFGLLYGLGALAATAVFVGHGPSPSGLPPYTRTVSVSSPYAPASEPVSDTSAVDGALDPPTGGAVNPGATTAPNGAPWPATAGYVDGYERLRTDGHSTVTVDNSHNATGMFVKLVAIEPGSTFPVRQVFIPRGRTFTIS